MTEPLTPRKERLLEVLSESDEPLAVREVNQRAFKTTSRESVVRSELFDLFWRKLVDRQDAVQGQVYSITDQGRVALNG